MKNLHKVCMVFALAAAMLVTSGMMSKDAQASFHFRKEVNNQNLHLKFFGFSQLEARGGNGVAENNSGGDGVRFTAQRIRLGTKFYADENVFGKLFLDFNKSHDTEKAGLPEMIKDAFVGYKYNKALFTRIGMIKTPNGLDYTTPGWNLDIVERNKMEKGLVLERDMGVLVSGRYLGFGEGSVDGTEMGHEHVSKGFGYDIGVFNPAGRSASVISDNADEIQDHFNSTDELNDLTGDEADNKLRTGEAHTYVGRLHFDWTELLHFETSYGVAQDAGGLGTEDYKVFDIGATSMLGPLNLKAEYIQGTDIQGIDGWERQTYVGTIAYHFTQQFEGVVKHYQAESEFPDAEDLSLGNTYFGVNMFLKPLADELTRGNKRSLQNHRLQLNYVLASGDRQECKSRKFEEGSYGECGKLGDAVLAQYQYKF